MKRLLATTLLLALAGCSGSGIHQEEPIKVVPPTTQVVPRVVPHNLSPAARTAAPKTDANESKGSSLMECVTNSCKINCSPKVAKRFRPKWCVYYTEPI